MRQNNACFGAVAVAFLLAGASAVQPKSREADGGSFTLNVYKRPQPRARVRRASLSDPIAPATDGNEWFVNATVGGQPVDLVVDTGSTDSWVIGNSISADGPAYDPTKSSTAFNDTNQHFSELWQPTPVTGDVIRDVFCIDDACVGDMIYGHQTNNANYTFWRSGMLGLGFMNRSLISPNKQPNFLEKLEPQLAQPVVTFKMAQSSVGKMTFGSWDPNDYTGDLTEITVNNATGLWLSDGVSLSKSTGGAPPTNLGVSTMHFDTGTRLTYAPEAVVRAYFAGFDARDINGDASQWQVACGTALPTFVMEFNTVQNGQYQVAFPVPQVPAPSPSNKWCRVLLTSSGSGEGSVGAALFETQVVVFNQWNATISMAPQKA